MKNDTNHITTTEQLIIHLFKNKKPSQYIKKSNINKNQSNNNIFNNLKHSLISHNINRYNKGGDVGLNRNNNLTNRTKYKTTKNSPEHILIQKNLSRQKDLVGLNHAQKQSKKIPVNNCLNTINKMLLQNKRHNNTIKIIKKKILQIKDKSKNMTTKNSNNNTISLNNSVNQNYNQNNSKNNSDYLQNKGIYLNKIKKIKNNEHNNNKINISLNQQPNSYREIKRRSNSNCDAEKIKNLKNYEQFINFGKKRKEKYYNLINKYISSVSTSSKQPLRHNQKKSSKNKYNTITAKKAISIKKGNSNNNTLSCRGTANPIIENIKLDKINNICNNGNINKIKHINYIQYKNIKNNNNFSSTTQNLYKPEQQTKKNQNFHFDTKAINKTSYQTKQTSRKHSSEKSAQNSINHSSINHIINSNSSNYIVKNYNSPVITINNHRKSDILNKKINFMNNSNNYYNNYSNNKNNISNGMYNSKYKFNDIYSNSNSKEHSKNKNKSNINNIKDLKKYNIEKIINQLYKHKDNTNLNNQNNNNIIYNNNFFNNKRDQIQEKHYSYIKNHNNNSSKINNTKYSPKEMKEKKNNIIKEDNINNNNIYHEKKMSENLNLNIIKKIKLLNEDNIILSYKNKELSPVAIKNNKDFNNNNVNQNSSINNNINNNNDDNNVDDNNHDITNLIINKNNELNDVIQKNKEKENSNNNYNNIINNYFDNIENKTNNNSKEKLCKIRDKDISCSENDNDSLLEYINNNIDYIPNNSNNTELSESNDSMMNTLKENGKSTCYNRDMEIISNYIKKYYKKNQKYPTTKMKFYKYGRLLGKGAFGKVNLSLHILTGRLVAIKSINKEKIKTDRQKKKIKLETTIMKRLSKSNNIVKFFETYETKKHICIVMEYICAGDLLGYIKKRNRLHEPVAKFIFKQIVLALKYIHQNNIVHRDIKLDNILIDLDNNIKICDFGVSKIISKNDIMLEQCGTPAYIAPEILLNKGYEGFSVDVWSAGVVLYAMLSGTVPFKGVNLKELHTSIISGNYQPINDISNEASHLLKNILEIDPKKRITTENILNHPWLIDVDLNFWKNQNLFTNAEYVLLAKSNVDYRNIANKEDMIEIFDLRNLDTIDENINKNVKTKSFILAPFNTSISDKENNESINNIIPLIYNNIIYNDNCYKNNKDTTDYNNPDLKILNGAIKYVAKVKELNRNYELNNNQEIDNGVVIIPNDSDEKNKKDNNDISPLNGSYNNKISSIPFSPPNEIEEKSNGNNNNNKEGDEINEKALEIIENLGYNKSFVRESILKNDFNYATASYKLIVKYFFP